MKLTFWQRSALSMLAGILFCASMVLWAPLAWFAIVFELLALCNASLGTSLFLGTLLGLNKGLIGFGLARYGAGPIALFIISCLIVQIVKSIGVALATRHLPSWIGMGAVALVYPVVSFFAEYFLGSFYVPVALADTQATWPAAIQIVAYTGCHGLTAVMALWGACMVQIISISHRGRVQRPAPIITTSPCARHGRSTLLRSVGLVCLLPLLTIGGGELRLLFSPQPSPKISVAAIKGGVPNWVYSVAPFVPQLESFIERKYFTLSRSLPRGSVNLVIWPEAAVRPSREKLAAFESHLIATAHAIKTEILAGFVRHEADGRLFNAAIFVSETGVQSQVAKSDLIPILESEFTASSVPQVIQTRFGPVGVLFCSESLRSDPQRHFGNFKPVLVIVIANDAGVGLAANALVHADRAALRAVALGVPVIHVGQMSEVRFYDRLGQLQARSTTVGPEQVVATVRLSSTN